MKKITSLMMAISLVSATMAQKKPAAPKAATAAAQPQAAAQPAATSAAAAPPQSTAPAMTEEKYSKVGIAAELLGAGVLASLMASYRPLDMIAVNAQFGYVSGSTSASSGSNTASASFSIILVPITASLLLGGLNHKFEVLGGATLAFVSGTVSSSGASGAFSGNGAIPVVGAGYRYQPHDGGFFFRATAYYFISTSSSASSIPWFGLSLGYAFAG